MDQLLQAGRHGKAAEGHRRMDEETNPHGVLETLEESKNKIPEFGEAGNQPCESRYPC